MEQTGATRGKSTMSKKKPNLKATLKAFKEKKTGKNDERLHIHVLNVFADSSQSVSLALQLF